MKPIVCLAVVASAAPCVAGIVGVPLGSGAPPPRLGLWAVSPVPPDPSPVFVDVLSCPASPPLSGPVAFDKPLQHRKIGQGWGTWSHGYTGDVYVTFTGGQILLTLPPDTAAFLLYAEPGPFQEYEISATTHDGTQVTQLVHGLAGAKGYGFYATDGDAIRSIHVVQTPGASAALAVGEFHGAPLPPPCPGDLDVDGDVDQADLGILLADFGCLAAPGGCPGDVDLDGDTAQSDLGVLLATFGATCN